MKIEKEVRGTVTTLPTRGVSTDPSLQALHQAATRLADARRGTAKFRTKELVGLLLSHGARTWRNSMPTTNVRLRVVSPEGRHAVRLRVNF